MDHTIIYHILAFLLLGPSTALKLTRIRATYPFRTNGYTCAHDGADIIYFIGGNTDRIHALNIVNDTVEEVPNIRLPFLSVAQLTMAKNDTDPNGCFFILGGTSTSFHEELGIFCPTEGTFEVVRMSKHLGGGRALVRNGTLYFYGREAGVTRQSLYKVEHSTGEVEKLAEGPEGYVSVNAIFLKDDEVIAMYPRTYNAIDLNTFSSGIRNLTGDISTQAWTYALYDGIGHVWGNKGPYNPMIANYRGDREITALDRLTATGWPLDVEGFGSRIETVCPDINRQRLYLLGGFETYWDWSYQDYIHYMDELSLV